MSLGSTVVTRFLATTDTLTCAGQGFRPMRGPGPVAPAGFPASGARYSHHSVPTHLMCPTWLFFRSPFSTGIDLRQLASSSSLGLRSPLAGSPSTSGRIGFVILRTNSLPPLLPTVESLHRSPFGLPGDELLPEADLHRSDRATRRRTSARALACCLRRLAAILHRLHSTLDQTRQRPTRRRGADGNTRLRRRSGFVVAKARGACAPQEV